MSANIVKYQYLLPANCKALILHETILTVKSKPELLSASVDQLLIESVETSAIRFNLLKVLLHLFPPFSLMRVHFC